MNLYFISKRSRYPRGRYYASRAQKVLIYRAVHEQNRLQIIIIIISGVYEQTGEASDSVQDNVTKTNKILVKNIPSVIDEEILEVFFESKKKGGGGPVKNIQLNREKNWAIVEFSEVNGKWIRILSLVMRKPVSAICEQQRRRSAWASAQSDQRLCCSLPG